MSVEMGTLASPDCPQRYGRPQHPKQLGQHHCLLGSVTRWNFVHHCSGEPFDIQLQGHLHCKNGRVLVKGAVNGNGIVRVPRIYCQSHIDAGELEEVFEQWHVPGVDFSVISHRDKYRPKRLRTFIDFVVAEFADSRE